jgi:predicted TIM-barrel fold metal-dependent hydrolase
MRLITVEEHFASRGFRAGPGREFMGRLGNSGARGARIVEQLTDVGSNRIAEMDAAGIEMQVISLNAPGVEQADPDVQVSLAQEANDFIAEAVKKYPKRLAAFAALIVHDAGAAGIE